VITGWNGEALALGFGVGIAAVIAGFGLSLRALPERMART
jgi:hypothetical protein